MPVQHAGEDNVPVRQRLAAVLGQLERIVVGKPRPLRLALACLIGRGHLLIEDIPGVGKSTLAQALAVTLGLKYARVQFTSDLLPADVLGGQVYNPREGTFTIRKGPLFANRVLADEINRAPAKVQSALLEAMQERQVTLADETFPLPVPFLVLATQNPIEQEGTYPLPEAQVDRFLMKIVVGYPTKDEEREILMRATRGGEVPQPVLTPHALARMQKLCGQITLKPVLADYIVSLVHTTRQAGSISPQLARYVQYGASPRATLALASCARAWAMLDGRDFATPDDVKDIALDVLRHRISLAYEAEAEGITADMVIKEILAKVKTP